MLTVCMQHVNCIYAACMLYVCSMLTVCMQHVCCMYAACQLYVRSMYAVCMRHVNCMYAACMLYVCGMLTVCVITIVTCTGTVFMSLEDRQLLSMSIMHMHDYDMLMSPNKGET